MSTSVWRQACAHTHTHSQRIHGYVDICRWTGWTHTEHIYNGRLHSHTHSWKKNRKYLTEFKTENQIKTRILAETLLSLRLCVDHSSHLSFKIICVSKCWAGRSENFLFNLRVGHPFRTTLYQILENHSTHLNMRGHIVPPGESWVLTEVP